MKVSLDGLMVLDAIARRGSFAGAAEELYRVPSAVTYMVQKLEQDLRVQLFDRSGHRAKLTAVGEDLLKNGRPLLRAAADLEQRVQLVAKGWEPEVCIAHDQLVAGRRLYGLVEAFYEQGTSTRLTVSAEVLGGAWQALLSGRADICIGAMGDPPSEPGITTRPLGEVEWVFAVAPRHPLAQVQQPVSTAAILGHRAVLLSDGTRTAPVRSPSFTLNVSDALMVSTIRGKIDAQIAGLGVGFLPRHQISDLLRDHRLVELKVEEPMENTQLCCAWRPQGAGKAVRWWLSRLEDFEVRSRLLE